MGSHTLWECTRKNLEPKKHNPPYDKSQGCQCPCWPMCPCDRGHPWVWQSQQGFSGNEESSTHSTSDLLSCVPQTPSLSAAPQPFGYSCWNSDRNPKPKVVWGYTNSFCLTPRVRSIRLELTWKGQDSRAISKPLAENSPHVSDLYEKILYFSLI